MAHGDLPVEGVEVHAQRLNEVELVGETGEDGRLVVPGGTPDILWLRHPRFVTSETPCPPHVEQEIVVLLEPAAALVGRVEVVDGSPLPEGLLVTAVPSRDHSPHGTRGAPGPANPRVASTRPAADGRFEIFGLDPAERYMVRAGARGWVLADLVTGARPGEEPLLLTLWPLYGFRLRLVTGTGEPPRTDSRATFLGETVFRVLDRAVVQVSERFDLLQLAEVDAADAQRWIDRSFVYVSPTVAERVGPISFHLRLAGYAPVAEELWAERVSGPEVKVHEVQLRPIAAAWGDLAVRFDRGCSPSAPEHPPGGHLELMTAGSEILRLAIGPDAEFELPVGSYRWRYLSEGDVYSLPPPEQPRLTVDIRPDETSEVFVECGEMGSLEVELATKDGLTHRGKAILRLGRADRERRGAFDHVTFSSWPYVLRSLPSGTWDVAAITGTTFAAPGFEEFYGVAEVSSGELTTVVLAER